MSHVHVGSRMRVQSCFKKRHMTGELTVYCRCIEYIVWMIYKHVPSVTLFVDRNIDLLIVLLVFIWCNIFNHCDVGSRWVTQSGKWKVSICSLVGRQIQIVGLYRIWIDPCKSRFNSCWLPCTANLYGNCIERGNWIR